MHHGSLPLSIDCDVACEMIQSEGNGIAAVTWHCDMSVIACAKMDTKEFQEKAPLFSL